MKKIDNKALKTVKVIFYLFALGVMIWSVFTDITTYNVYFQTDKNIILYCIDGIIFNLPKIILPLFVAITIDVFERIMIARENRTNRCR